MWKLFKCAKSCLNRSGTHTVNQHSMPIWQLWACVIRNVNSEVGGGRPHPQYSSKCSEGQGKITSWLLLPKSLPRSLWRQRLALAEAPPPVLWQLPWEKAPEDPCPIALTSGKKCKTTLEVMLVCIHVLRSMTPRSAPCQMYACA